MLKLVFFEPEAL